MKKKRICYWDSLCFLRVMNNEPEHERYDETIGMARKKEIQIATSSLALVEVIKLKGHTPMTEDDETKIRRYFEHEYISVQAVTRTIAENARKHIWNDGLKYMDAIHLATARFMNASEMHTEDSALARLDGRFGFYIGRPRNIQGELPKISQS